MPHHLFLIEISQTNIRFILRFLRLPSSQILFLSLEQQEQSGIRLPNHPEVEMMMTAVPRDHSKEIILSQLVSKIKKRDLERLEEKTVGIAM